jgi:hypothetical protein
MVPTFDLNMALTGRPDPNQDINLKDVRKNPIKYLLRLALMVIVISAIAIGCDFVQTIRGAA